MSLFTIKYAPQNSKQIFGQEKAIIQLKDFIVNYQKQKERAALLYGPVGNGKTSSVYALTKELDYDILEINSSDLRNEAGMSSLLGAALGQQSLFFRPKIILIDDIDALSGIYDRGGLSALTKAMETAKFPIILTANDPYDQKLKALRKGCKMIEFVKLDHKTVSHALQWVAQQEQIATDPKAISTLARQVDGDLRGALLDLQCCSSGKQCMMSDLRGVSDRKRRETIINALLIIFKSSTVQNALGALDDVDMDYSEIFLWMDENLPKEYSGKSLCKAYEHLSRADVFQGRIRRWQHWRFLSYMADLLTAGISSAKEQKNTSFVSYKPTMRLLRQWQAKQKHAAAKDIAEKLAGRTHTSQRVAFQQLSYLKKALGQPAIAKELELSDEEVAWVRK